jgi:TP901 family phage tail tape measure protein
MANAIGFGELFNKEDFNSGLGALKELIVQINTALGKTSEAASALNTVLGGELKEKVNALTSSNSALDAELKKVKADFDEFKKSVSSTKTTINQYKGATEKLDKEVVKIENDFKKLNTTQKSLNSTTKVSSITMGQLSQSLIGVASGAALLYKGAVMLKDQFKQAYRSAIDFEKAIKEVQAITRSSGDAIKLLTADANRLGASTEKTSVEIAGLQKELAKLGFSVQEILASSGGITDLSTATGEDLVKSATVAASTLRAFGLEATEMTRVVNVMSGSFVRSGLDLEKFREAIKLVAPIARATNLELEVTTASLSKLADAGLSGSLAGTALRNLMSNMSSTATKLGARIGFAVDSTEKFIEAFKKLKREGVGLEEAIEIVDVRARPAFFTILNQIEAIEGLTLEYKILDGEARKIADTMRSTLSNDIAIASSAFDAMRRNMVEDTLPAFSSLIKSVTTTGEFIRFFISDVRSMISAIDGTLPPLAKFALGFHPLIGAIKAFQGVYKEMEKTAEENKTREALLNLRVELEGASKSIKTASQDIELMESVLASIDTKQFHILNSEAVKLDKRFKDIVDSNLSLDEKMKLLKFRLGQAVGEADNLNKQYTTRLETARKELKAIEDINATTIVTNKSRAIEMTLTNEVKNLERLLLGTVSERAKIEQFVLELKEKGLYYSEEDLKLQSELLKIQYDLNIEMARTREMEAKINFERDSSLETLDKYKKARIETANLVLQKELELIKETEEQEEIRIIKSKLAYEKHKQTRIGIEESTVKSLLKLHEEMYAKMVAEDEAYLERFKKHAEDVAKSFEVAIQEIKGINDIMPKQEEAWRNMSSEVDYFNKSREGGLKKFLKLKKEESELIKKGKEQNDSLNDADMDRLLQLKDELVEFEKLTRQGIATALRAVSQGVSMLYDNAAIRRQNELVAIDRWEQERIRLAGDNQEAITAIEEEAEAKRRKIKIEQAKADKREALFQIAIQTAVNLVRVAWQPWLVAGVALLGAAQAAIVAARPLPEFYKGTDNAPEGHAWVGERGRELVKDGKTGKVSVTPDKPTIAYLTKGSVVIPHEKTERILASHNPDYNGIVLGKSVERVQSNQPSIDYDKLIGGFKTAVKDIPLTTTNFDENGVRQFVRKGNARIERLNARYKY